MVTTPSAQYSLMLRVEIDHLPGMPGKVASAIGSAGETIGAVDLVGVEAGHTIKRNAVAVVSDGSARPGRHRSSRGDARDGGHGDAVRGVRGHRRVSDLPGHHDAPVDVMEGADLLIVPVGPARDPGGGAGEDGP